jgi:glycosylphosphatidylinositol transamidase (GPIT) subunit GPI8
MVYAGVNKDTHFNNFAMMFSESDGWTNFSRQHDVASMPYFFSSTPQLQVLPLKDLNSRTAALAAKY